MTATDLATVRAEERRIMNLYAPVYDAAVKTNGYVYQIERAQFVEWVAKTLRDAGRDPRTESVLDVGCGTGRVSELLVQAGFTSVTGMDFADGMLVRRGSAGSIAHAGCRRRSRRRRSAARRSTSC